MLWTIIVILLVLWLLGMGTAYTLGIIRIRSSLEAVDQPLTASCV